ncbi:unnamed protein product [Adineta ricciae]|uniref:Transposase n=1 Tax=Adineta ricciae TaxID=249248 RepID=A0A814TN37_ADIRI|nr:unnamed protein product [Adineta ricciae]
MLIHRIERSQSIDHHYYINQCLRSLIDEIKRRRPAYGTLESGGLKIILHPPNSPDVSPCDFLLFDLIEDDRGNQDDSLSLHDALIDFMNSINREEYRETFEKWIERMQPCVDNHGDYFERSMK